MDLFKDYRPAYGVAGNVVEHAHGRQYHDARVNIQGEREAAARASIGKSNGFFHRLRAPAPTLSPTLHHRIHSSGTRAPARPVSPKTRIGARRMSVRAGHDTTAPAPGRWSRLGPFVCTRMFVKSYRYCLGNSPTLQN